ncbi:MAG: TRAP transporter large permease [Hyphomicrobiales bacterium]|nr:TRAP transporter large permease [Hyphomicrobiales bacterium]
MILFIVMFVLAFFGVPIAFAMGAAAVLQLLIMGDASQLAWVPKRMVEGLASFPLLAVPFFILAAELMNSAGIAERIFRFAHALAGSVRGGLGQVNIIGSVIFSGMSGSAIADTAGLGKIEIKAMTDDGYDAPFAAAITAASATVGPIIPPSIPLVIYAVIAEESVAKLLIAGTIPGFLIALALALVVYWRARQRNYPRHGTLSLGNVVSTFRSAFLALMTPVILIGGILTGWFTPTEAAIVGATYALALTVFVYRELSMKELWEVFIRAGLESAKVLLIVCMAYPVTLVLTAMELPQQFVIFFVELSDSKIVFLLLSNLVLLILGCVMESVSALIIVVPLLLAAATKFGVDPIHFGVIVVMNLMIGLITPPFGLNMFITCQIAGIRQGEFVREAIPFYVILIMALMVVTFVPSLSTWLPNYAFSR